MNMTKIFAKSKSFLKRESPTILSILGAAGVIATAIMAVKATPKAMHLIEKARCEKADDQNPIADMAYVPVLTKTEIVKAAWKPYIPSVILGAATITCIFGANVLNRRQQAALSSAYLFLEQSYKEYRNKVKTLYGEDADKKVDAEIAKDKFTDEEMVPVFDGEKCLFFEEHYGHFFERTMLEVRDAEYQLNRKLAKEGEASLNDFMEFLDLPNVKDGDILGWGQEDCFDFYNYTWIEFEHVLLSVGEDMECYMIKTTVQPTVGYDVPF